MQRALVPPVAVRLFLWSLSYQVSKAQLADTPSQGGTRLCAELGWRHLPVNLDQFWSTILEAVANDRPCDVVVALLLLRATSHYRMVLGWTTPVLLVWAEGGEGVGDPAMGPCGRSPAPCAFPSSRPCTSSERHLALP